MPKTLYQVKSDLAMMGQELDNANAKVLDLAANATVEIADVKAAETERDAIQARFDLIKGEHDRMEKEAEAEMKAKTPIIVGDEKGKLIQAKAAFYRGTLLRQPVAPEVLNVLQAIPAGGGSGGENFLPTQLSTELIHEPYFTNMLRGIIRISAVKGLELPRIAFTLDGGAYDSLTDDSDANEVDAAGDKVSFGRFKTKVIAKIADSVIHGSDINLVNEVENALRSGLALKESNVSFATSPAANEDHMSFYEEESAAYVISEVGGATLFAAITNAIADLNEAFRANAKVVMTYADYVAILSALANGNAAFFSAPPEQIIGKPVTFCDGATIPIIGDFNYAQLNYDGEPTYDTDKDVVAGDYLFVLTAWFDQQRKLDSAFRLAVVDESV